MFIPMIADPNLGDPNLGDPNLGSFWLTPGDQRNEENSVNTAVQSLDADISNSPAVDASFLGAWQAFKSEWDSFYAGQGGITGWLDRFATASGYDKTEDYRTQLAAWQQKFQQLGGAVSVPGLVPPPTSNTPEIFKYIAITAGILGGLWVASTLYKEVRGRAPAVSL